MAGHNDKVNPVMLGEAGNLLGRITKEHFAAHLNPLVPQSLGYPAEIPLGLPLFFTHSHRDSRHSPELEKWSSVLAREFLPGMLSVSIENEATGLPPVLDKPARPEPVNGWLCRGVSCLAPISDLAALRSACKGAGLG